MDTLITTTDLAQSPELITSSFTLPNGTEVTFRLLAPQDARILGRYFLGLSENTKHLYGPHPFDQATADRLCATINPAETLRFIAVAGNGEKEQVIAYIILVPGVAEVEQKRYLQVNLNLDPRSDCTFAPSVSDAYQNQGLGTQLGHLVMGAARRLGFKRMILMGGVMAVNVRGIHFYQKLGFRIVKQFEHPAGMNNFDMIVDL